MSRQASDAAWQVRGLKPQSKLVLLALANRADDATRICWPGLETLAGDTGLDYDSIRKKWLPPLVSAGYVRIVAKGNGASNSTRYLVRPEGGLNVPPSISRKVGYPSGKGGPNSPKKVGRTAHRIRKEPVKNPRAREAASRTGSVRSEHGLLKRIFSGADSAAPPPAPPPEGGETDDARKRRELAESFARTAREAVGS